MIKVMSCPLCGTEHQAEVSPAECCGCRCIRGECERCGVIITYTGHAAGCPLAGVERPVPVDAWEDEP